MQRLVRLFALPLAILVLWIAASHFGWVNTLLLPRPEDVMFAAIEMVRSGEWVRHVLSSFSRSLAGFAVSALLAMTLAFWLAGHRRSRESMELVLESVRVVPPLSLVPLLILWLGIGEAPKIAIVILASFFPIYLSALTSFTTLHNQFSELAEIYHLSPKEKFFEISLPASLPQLITGLRLGFGYSWRALVGAELLGAASGLGYLIQDASELARSDRMMVGILSIALLGILGDCIFRLIAKKYAPWSVIRK